MYLPQLHAVVIAEDKLMNQVRRIKTKYFHKDLLFAVVNGTKVPTKLMTVVLKSLTSQ